MARKKEIIVKHGVIKRIAKDVSVSEPTVRYALRGVIDTDIANTIRKRAIDLYGGVTSR
jgi:hypothetical protein|nr:MAG TPA: PURINE NUCLEOTIDE SYNTHESIS REPRESSOR/DNA Complex REGULATION, DNA-BINDING, REPRESSOR, PURINE [Caudoviricetes sp.]